MEGESVYQVDSLIEKLEEYPDDYQVRVDVEGEEVPPKPHLRGPETVVL